MILVKSRPASPHGKMSREQMVAEFGAPGAREPAGPDLITADAATGDVVLVMIERRAVGRPPAATAPIEEKINRSWPTRWTGSWPSITRIRRPAGAAAAPLPGGPHRGAERSSAAARHAAQENGLDPLVCRSRPPRPTTPVGLTCRRRPARAAALISATVRRVRTRTSPGQLPRPPRSKARSHPARGAGRRGAAAPVPRGAGDGSERRSWPPTPIGRGASGFRRCRWALSAGCGAPKDSAPFATRSTSPAPIEGPGAAPRSGRRRGRTHVTFVYAPQGLPGRAGASPATLPRARRWRRCRVEPRGR